jgi:rRNA-processing protein FCF1
MSDISSYIHQIKLAIQEIELEMVGFIGKCEIEEFHNDPYSNVVMVAPTYYWGKLTDNQKQIQMGLKKDFIEWLEHFNLLFINASESTKDKIDETQKFLLRWIEQEYGDWSVSANTQKNIIALRKEFKILYDFIKIFENKDVDELIVIPDTNSLIICQDFKYYKRIVEKTSFSMILIPTVLEELDKLKIVHRERDFRDKINSIIRRIKGLRQQGSLLKGVTVDQTITVKMIAVEPNFEHTLSWLDPSNSDDRIIANALELQRGCPSSKVLLVTNDINLQNKAEMAKIPYCEPA